MVVNGICKCKPGFYTEGTNCKPCAAGCQTCDSATTCTCATGAFPNGDGTCSCKSGTVLIAFASTLYCQPCASNCASCQGSASNCLACKPGFEIVGGKCTCKAGTFPSAEGIQCFPCIDKCKKCNDESSCITCESRYKVQN